MSSKEIAQQVFQAGLEVGDSRDTIIVEMVKQGLTLNTAQIQYKELAQEAGIASARVGHKKEALEYLDTHKPDILDEEIRGQVRSDLQEEFGVASSTANDYIKAWADQEGIELPRSNFGGNPEDQQKIFDWIVANKDAEKPTFVSFMKDDMGRSPGSIDETWRGVILARKLQSAGVVFDVPAEAA